MLVDARTIEHGTILTGDVCIIGAGAAGITAALALAGQSRRIIVLEGGGLRLESASQSLYQGTTTGHRYYPLDACRFRLLGGTTNHWGGWCRPLDDLDFEERDWVPHSGWPFPKRHLEDEYRRAWTICNPGPGVHDDSSLRAHHPSLLPPDGQRFGDTVFQIAPTRFGETYRAELASARDLTLILHANALEIETNDGVTATRVRAATGAGNHFAISASLFVLAAGGIENPRILLASRRVRSCGIGNEHGLVGRFFADHLHAPIGTLRLEDAGDSRFYQVRRNNGAGRVRGGISLGEEARRRERLLGFAVTLHNADDPHDVLVPTAAPSGYESLRVLGASVRTAARPERLGHHVVRTLAGFDQALKMSYRKMVKPRARRLTVGCRAEQAPNPDSRIALADAKDRFGMPTVRLHWELSPQDCDSFRAAARMFVEEMGPDRVELAPGLQDGDAGWAEQVTAAAHHLGTTRMHRSPSEGVVDEHCRVHSMSNLYVAGSSVFPTAGWAPPTLTIVALALRLADHLKHRLGHG